MVGAMQWQTSHEKIVVWNGKDSIGTVEEHRVMIWLRSIGVAVETET